MTWNFSHRIANPIQVYDQEIILSYINLEDKQLFFKILIFKIQG